MGNDERAEFEQAPMGKRQAMSKLSDVLLALAGNRLIDNDYKPVIIGREQVRALAAQAQELERDAARYRWLKKHHSGDYETFMGRKVYSWIGGIEFQYSTVDEGIDAAIDAAIAKESHE